MQGQPLFARSTNPEVSAMLSGHGVDENIKSKVTALEKASRSVGGYKITSARMLDAVLEKAEKTKENETLRAVKVLQDLFGAPVALLTTEGEFQFHGVFHGGVIWLDATSDISLPAVFGHELSHRMEIDNPIAYRILLGAVKPMLGDMSRFRKLYGGLAGMSDADVQREMLGDVMGDRFTEAEFWREVAKHTSRTDLQKVINVIRVWLDRLIAKLSGIGSEDFAADLIGARKIIAKAVAEYADRKRVRPADHVGWPLYSRASAPRQIHGIKNGKITAVAAIQPNGQYEIYWGNGPTLLTSQQFRRQTVAGIQQVRTAFAQAGLTPKIPTPSGHAVPTTAPLFSGFDVPAEKLTDLVLRKAQDKFRRLKTIERTITDKGGLIDEGSDAYLWEELMHGKTEERIREFEEEHVKPLIKAISDAKVKIEDVDQYLYAKHAPERNAHIAGINPHFRDNDIPGSGMSDAEAKDILDDFDRRGLTAKLDGVAQKVWAINEARLQLLEEEGLENEQTLDLWRQPYQHYVPLRGFDGEADETRPRAGRGFDIRGKESKRAMGRGRKALSPMTYTISQMEESMIRAEKNEVGRAFLKLVEANPNPELWEINKVEYAPKYDSKTGEVEYGPKPGYQHADNVMSVKVDGSPVLITIHDEGLASAMKNLGPQTSNVVLRTLAAVNRYFAIVSTSLNPEFILTNFARDVQTAMINLYGEQGARGHLAQPRGIVRKVIKDLPKAMAGVYAAERGVDAALFGAAKHSKAVNEWAKHYTEFRAAGGKVGFFGLETVEVKRKQLHSALKQADGGATAQAKKVVHITGELIMDVNTAVENAIRLAAYKNARDLGLSEAHAASLAKNLTVNFNRKGELGAVANGMYLFYNAGVQGTMRFLYALKSPKVQKIALGIVAAQFLLSEMNRWLGGDDDDGRNFLDKIPNHIKDRNLIIMKPDGKGGYYKVPLPYGYNVLHVMGSSLNGIVHGHDPMKEAVHLTMAFMDSFNPLGGADAGIVQLISPTITDTVVQIAMNENFYGGKLRPENKDFSSKKPDSQLYWNSVSPAAHWLTDTLNELTGGNTVRPGAIDVSPETVEHMATTVAGGAGAFLLRTGNYIGSVLAGDDVPVQNVPFKRRFVGEQSAHQAPKDFYANRDEIFMAKEEVKAFRKQGKYAEAEEKVKENAELLRLYPRATDLNERLQRDNKRIRDTRANRNLSEDEKRDRIKRIQENMADDIGRFNKKYYETTGKTPD